MLYELRSEVDSLNYSYFGVWRPLFLDVAGDELAKELVNDFPAAKSFAFVVSDEAKGGLALSCAEGLRKRNPSAHITIYCTARLSTLSEDSPLRHYWRKLKQLSEITFHQEVKPADIQSADVVIEAMSSTIEKASKKIREVVKRVSHFKKPIVALDTPTQGYTPKVNYCLFYPKSSSSRVININPPKQLETEVGPGELSVVFKPKLSSYKSQNGKLVILGEVSKDELAKISFYQCEVKHYADLASLLDLSLQDFEEAGAIYVASGFGRNLIEKLLLNYLLEHFNHKNFVMCEPVNTSAKNVSYCLERSDLNLLLNQSSKSTDVIGAAKRYSAENHCFVSVIGSGGVLFGCNPFSQNVESRFSKLLCSASELGLLQAALASKNHPWIAANAAHFLFQLAAQNDKLVNEIWEDIVT